MGLLPRGDAVRGIAKVTTLVAALWAAPLSAQVVELTPNQVLALAADSLRNDRPGDAAVAMDAFLAQIPDNATALLLRTEAAILLDDFPGAVAFGQRAFWQAGSDGQRFNAARLTALGYARQMQDTRAQLWLRAARQFAPSDAASEAVARDFQALRQRNPLSVSLRFGITPSDNINGGTFNETIDINFGGFILPFVLSEDARALSGWEFSGSTNLRYRLHSNQTSATFLDAGFTGTTFALTESSRNALGDLAERNDEREKTGQDFSFARFNVGAAHIFALAPDVGITEASLVYSRTLRRDEDERHAVTATLSHRYALSDSSFLTVTASSERQRYVEGGDDILSYRLNATYGQTIENVGAFSIGYGIEESQAERSTDEFDATSYSLSFSPAAPVLGVDLGLSLTYREIDWDFYDNFNGPRSDEVLTARATATLRDIELFGFNPILSITREEQDSTAVRYQTNSTTFGVDIVSSF